MAARVMPGFIRTWWRLFSIATSASRTSVSLTNGEEDDTASILFTLEIPRKRKSYNQEKEDRRGVFGFSTCVTLFTLYAGCGLFCILRSPKTWKSRPASKAHLNPEPKVQCTLLHQPAVHTLDVIFVHGLYGSLANTWRQGEWRPKYTSDPEKVHLRRPTLIPTQRSCSCCDYTKDTKTQNRMDKSNITELTDDSNDSFDDENDFFNNEDIFTNIDEKFYNKIKHILPSDETFTTEKFYNNTLLNHVEIVDNYEAQAMFVSDLFKNCDNSVYNRNIDSDVNFNDNDGNVLSLRANKSIFKQNMYNYEINQNNYSNNANLTEDTVNKCNDNYDIDGNCMSHNKAGIDKNKVTDDDNYIKAIKDEKCRCREDIKIDGEINEINCKCKTDVKQCDVGCGCLCDECYSSCWPRDWVKEDYPGARVISIDYTSDPHLWRPLWIKENKRLRLHERAEQMMQQLLEMGVGQKPVIWVGHSKGGLFIKQIYCEAYEAYLKTKDSSNHASERSNNEAKHIDYNSYKKECSNTVIDNSSSTVIIDDAEIINEYDSGMSNTRINVVDEVVFDEESSGSNDKDNDLQSDAKQQESSNDADLNELSLRGSLWLNSAGFMFYSVPHRGSSLADIKTPVTARSVELLEISKDCALVLSLQERWLRAAAAAPRAPLVRSLVETRRTLMSVLWLRIVSYDSADPGLGALCGVSVDHREICKPSSRRCLLYTELKALIGAAIAKCIDMK